MLDTIYDGVNFFKAWVFAIIIWGTLCVAIWYYFFSDARRSSFHGGGLSDFIDIFPQWLVNGVLAAWFITGTFPFLNYMADKEQFGSVVGRAREMGFFDERPWYGVGGYQFLAIVLVLLISYLFHRYVVE
ncbi:hypothetical protein BBB56_23075 [Candidatus Pantoea deserta]|uniref:Uncharacterized protein n=1 Tax=Candidatus Pantoea deserta TaxID=1869313 RepID=A0A3N4NX98_9GAMM|nr:hypothetical protein [Pantoea deserta]RPD91753.1 hypothetical protein BBB56_23075 [Pantoea deserta]